MRVRVHMRARVLSHTVTALAARRKAQPPWGQGLHEPGVEAQKRRVLAGGACGTLVRGPLELARRALALALSLPLSSLSRARALSRSLLLLLCLSLPLSLSPSLSRPFICSVPNHPPSLLSLSLYSLGPLVRLSLSLSLALSLSVSLRVSRVFQWVHEAHQEQSGKVAMEADETAQVSAERGSPPLGTTLRMPATGL